MIKILEFDRLTAWQYQHLRLFFRMLISLVVLWVSTLVFALNLSAEGQSEIEQLLTQTDKKSLARFYLHRFGMPYGVAEEYSEKLASTEESVTWAETVLQDSEAEFLERAVGAAVLASATDSRVASVWQNYERKVDVHRYAKTTALGKLWMVAKAQDLPLHKVDGEMSARFLRGIKEELTEKELAELAGYVYSASETPRESWKFDTNTYLFLLQVYLNQIADLKLLDKIWNEGLCPGYDSFQSKMILLNIVELYSAPEIVQWVVERFADLRDRDTLSDNEEFLLQRSFGYLELHAGRQIVRRFVEECLFRKPGQYYSRLSRLVAVLEFSAVRNQSHIERLRQLEERFGELRERVESAIENYPNEPLNLYGSGER